MSAGFEIQLIAVIISVACALPGTFLVLRKMSMMTDSITHTILLGIVLAFFITWDLKSPVLIIGAALMGVFTVWLTETIISTKIVSKDASIGLVFPLLFSVAIILISKYAGSSHLCTDSVLLGEIAFAPFDRLVIMGVDIGAKSIYMGGALFLFNLFLIVLFFKELKLVTFDPMLAAAVGISPVIIHYGLMSIVSLTAVVSFEAVGSILVIAFMIGPPVTAYLLVDDLKKLLCLSGVFGATAGIGGYQLAKLFDISIAGSMAIVVGIVFVIVFILAPKRGLISIFFRKKRQKKEFAIATLMMHIYSHQNTADEFEENGINTISTHLYWERKKTDKIINILINEGKAELKNDMLILTPHGINATESAVGALLKI